MGAKIQRVEVYNIFGHLLISEDTHSQTHSMSIERLKSGTYFVKTILDNSKVIHKQIIKQ